MTAANPSVVPLSLTTSTSQTLGTRMAERISARGAGERSGPRRTDPSGAVRARFGQDMILVTPGIRPAGASAADQKRTMAPAAAIAAGADYLVVGRPVVQAKNPRSAAEAIISEIAAVQS
jgi:orotidine-5'-phosphate decarboxylase